jgi:nicotinamide-nucleotide amidase
MALGALDKSGADYAVAVTGLAGPGGDGTAVPVGTVWIAAAGREGMLQSRMFRFAGSRNEIREYAAREALEVLLKQIFLGENNGNDLPSPV